MTGLTQQGFERKRLPEIKEEIETALRLRFGNTINLESESVFGQLVGVSVLPLAELWEQAENIFLSQSPLFAEDVQLDHVVALNGITRLAATKTTVPVIAYGQPGTTIPKDSIVRVTDGDVFYLQEDITIQQDRGQFIQLSVNELRDNQYYGIDVNAIQFSTVTTTNPTAGSILSAIGTAINNSSQPINAELVDNTLKIFADNPNQNLIFNYNNLLTADHIGEVGFFENEQFGERIVETNTITEISTPVSGWRGIESPYVGDVGNDRESDVALRKRRLLSVSFAAQSTYDSIIAKLSALTGVDEAQLFVNNSDITDSNSIPPQHVYPIVKGGDNAEIAQVLYENMPLGIGMVGNVAVDVQASNGQSFTQRFERPADVPVYITIDIVATAELSVTIEQDIKTNLINYVLDNQKIGDALIYSRLYDPIQDVSGFYVNSLRVGRSSNPTGTSNLGAAINELFTLETGNIQINIT